MLMESIADLDQVAEFLEELQKLKPKNDDKLQQLIKLLKSDPVLKQHKVIIFSEYVTTARYLRQQLEDAGIAGLDEVDSLTKRAAGHDHLAVRALLQRVVQRRDQRAWREGDPRAHLDRRALRGPQPSGRHPAHQLRPALEPRAPHAAHRPRRPTPEPRYRSSAFSPTTPTRASIRRTVAFWNFLPPDELNDCSASTRWSRSKTLRISQDLRHRGQEAAHDPRTTTRRCRISSTPTRARTTPTEEMHLEFQQLLIDDHDLAAKLDALPGRVFSGKQRPEDASDAVFFCYALPAPGVEADPDEPPARAWQEELGSTAWYLYDLASASHPRGTITNYRDDPLHAAHAKTPRRRRRDSVRHSRPGREAHQEHLPQARERAGGRQADSEVLDGTEPGVAAMVVSHRSELEQIRTFPQLIRFLRDEMGWPIESEDFEDLDLRLHAKELGIDPAARPRSTRSSVSDR